MISVISFIVAVITAVTMGGTVNADEDEPSDINFGD